MQGDRTAQLEAQRARDAAAQAERARDVAQASIDAKSAMMSRLSHELRAPLNAVIGFSHLLLTSEDPLSDQHRHRLGLIQDAGRHLLALVEDVLLVNRLGSGALGLDLQPVSLTAVVADVLALQQPQMDKRALRLLPPTPATANAAVVAHADPRRVREILVINRLGAETSQIEGTGLGLNISRGLAQAMGGDIEVISEPGVGSTFSLILPTTVPTAP